MIITKSDCWVIILSFLFLHLYIRLDYGWFLNNMFICIVIKCKFYILYNKNY